MQQARKLSQGLNILKTLSTRYAGSDITFLKQPSWTIQQNSIHHSPLCQEYVSLNNIADLPGARRQGKRLGRGIGSGKGKTSGRGHKGQKARTGRKVKIGFEGGQSPLKEATPKRGFKNRFAITYTPLNLERLKECLDSGRLPNEGVITMKDLRDSGTIQKRIRDGVKLLGRGASGFNRKVHLQVTAASDNARQAIEKSGGTVTTVYYNKLGLRALVMPDWFDKKQRLLPKPARPPPKKWGRHDVIGSLPPNRVVPASTEGVLPASKGAQPAMG